MKIYNLNKPLVEKWFAWYPVVCVSGYIVWLEYVYKTNGICCATYTEIKDVNY